MAATQVQCGVTNNRINREPLDNETVLYSYADLIERIQPNGAASTKKGFFYGGLITSVINDENASYNGPWYISYEVSGSQIAYHASRISTKEESDAELYMLLHQPEYTKPRMSVQFRSAVNNELTRAQNTDVYEDVEIGTTFTPSLKVNWPVRTASDLTGTRMRIQNPTPQNIEGVWELGYSYGLNQIVAKSNGASKSFKTLDGEHTFNAITVTDETPINAVSDIRVDYKKSSYMYYPQLFAGRRYEVAYGAGDTAWFDAGSYMMPCSKYVVTGRYRYYWGFSDKVPSTIEEVKAGRSALLNSTKYELGTVTSDAVADGKDKLVFWVAYPSMYSISPYDSSTRVNVMYPDGLEFDLITPDQNMKAKKLNIPLGNSASLKDDYTIAYSEFECPIGNANALVSFSIIPTEFVDAVFSISTEDGTDYVDEFGLKTFRTESSNNMIIDDVVFE